jgi:hypothetical protein
MVPVVLAANDTLIDSIVMLACAIQTNHAPLLYVRI